MNPSTKKRIIWSLDAFEVPSDTNVRVSHVVRMVAAKTGAEVEPVFILSADRLSLPSELTQESTSSLQALAEEKMAGLCRQFDVPAILPPKILVQTGHSTTKSAQALIRYGHDVSAEMIILGSHGLKGVGRFFLGSFAETVLSYSDLPVLTVGRHYGKQSPMDHILFPTDFSAASRTAWNKVIGIAKSWNARVTLFHFVPHPIEPIIQTGINALGGGWVSFHNYLSDIEKAQREELETWARSSRDSGVTTDCHATSAAMNAAEGILTFAGNHNPGMIAMAAHSGPVSAALLGSVSREIVRDSSWPVLVLRST